MENKQKKKDWVKPTIKSVKFKYTLGGGAHQVGERYSYTSLS